MAMRAVRHIRARPPCKLGSACAAFDVDHAREFSHPDDDDYGLSIRVHGGIGEFRTLRQCFSFMDPYRTGYVDEPAALKELLRHLAFKSAEARRRRWFRKKEVWEDPHKIQKVWASLDTDGNGFVSFPEFCEWASTAGKAFEFPRHVGIVGAMGKAGKYELKCTFPNCRCTNFVSRGPPYQMWCSVKGCCHKVGYHSATPEQQILAVLPRDWKLMSYSGRASAWLSSTFTGASPSASLVDKYQLIDCGPEVVAQIQQLMDLSAKQTWTRDRGRNPVPSAYQVVRVQKNENVRLWLKYVMKKALIREAIEPKLQHTNLPSRGSWFRRTETKQDAFEEYEMRTSPGARDLPIFQAHPIEGDINEWLLWHGASWEGAVGIAHKEFKQRLAGSTTGTLYGRGTYLADSCTKADEYGKAVSDADPDLLVLLLCRVAGGVAFYTDEVTPDANALEQAVFRGSYDCVFGDREKCRGTFKEIVIYDSAQAYPEFLVHYRRIYDPPPAPPTGSAAPSTGSARLPSGSARLPSGSAVASAR